MKHILQYGLPVLAFRAESEENKYQPSPNAYDKDVGYITQYGEHAIGLLPEG